MTNDIEIHGFKELDESLRQFPILLQEDILKKAMVAGARIYQEYAQAHAPVGTVPHKNKKGQIEQPGTGRASIRVRKIKANADAAVRYAVGIFKQGWYMKLHETGWQPTGPWKKQVGMTNVLDRRGYWKWRPSITNKVFRRKMISQHERVPPNPFLQPAYDRVTNTVLDTVRRTIGIWITKYKTPRRIGSRG